MFLSMVIPGSSWALLVSYKHSGSEKKYQREFSLVSLLVLVEFLVVIFPCRSLHHVHEETFLLSYSLVIRTYKPCFVFFT